MSPLDAAPTALIVHAHPEPHSFSTAQMATAAQALRDAGYRVDVLDLYADAWAPTLAREEFAPAEGHFKPQAEQMRAVENGTLDATVKTHLDRLLAADLLVLSFPLWWFSLPAILKGWVDRVFVMGAVFGGDYGLFGDAALAEKRAMLLFTTGGPSESFRPGGAFGSMDDFLFHIHRGMLEFVGFQVLDPVVTYGPARMTDQERAAALDAVRASVALIAADSGTIVR
ncbi:NAD(P)H-dependent oxidoreductase [Streptomyces resistomycificus]|uniref:NAD(P)H dehydrogenase n=1 Tax=Streptomyces resistomycificus TaxID=67356 RepID=A0A0L8KZG8_9ACTN|nr:NAD(P)H-dependent oxidoreductase [Streptomyces resistomycificus]KOG31332.1 NAD(P)H dehydrogenase [Streptomyces resistomycificus]KUN94316.1 NAD(P)H dehydrogenase [Streptomyces resistomycificus]